MRALFLRLRLALGAFAFMGHVVYKLSYKTTWGARRIYIGYTANKEWRMVWHKVKANSWNLHRGRKSDLKWAVLESQIDSKPRALALEAFHAARAVAAEPGVARGGPYARPTLTKAMLDEARLVSGMRLAAMMAFGVANPDGPLGLHLKDMSFTRSARPGQRGVVVKRRRSGADGASSRRSQMARGSLKRKSAHERRVHRGVDPKAARRRETARRKQRLATVAMKRAMKRAV